MEVQQIQDSHTDPILKDILKDRRFKSSPQMSAFLSYIVKETKNGNAQRIKAYTIAVDALGKPPTFDPQSNPSVRVLARRLRSNLDDYYANEGRTAETVISIKLGSYIPILETRSHIPEEEPFESVVQHRPSAPNIFPAHALDIATQWFTEHHRYATFAGLLVMALIVWISPIGQNNVVLSESEININDETEKNLLSIDIASMEIVNNLVERPSTPVITMINNDIPETHNKLSAQLFNAISNYKNITLSFSHPEKSKRNAYWPEQYELKYSSNKNDQLQIELKHSLSDTVLIKKEISQTALKELGKSIANTNGTLMKDYRERGNISPMMKCVFMFDDYYENKTRKHHNQARQCATKLLSLNDLGVAPFTL